VKVTIFYTLLPLATHAALLAALFAARSIPTEALRLAPGMVAFLLGGVVFVPCILLYTLVAIVRYRQLQNASKARLFLKGICNPVPVFFLFWLGLIITALILHV
jgi:hypothetical protein